MTVALLGSCRQNAARAVVHCVDLHDYITYPHYSREIIQALKYCKGDNTIPEWCFRSWMLTKTLDAALIRAAYASSSTVMVEIASRIQYTCRGYFVHHIATEEQYGFPYKNEILTSDMKDDEIEQDIIDMRALVYPKRLVVCTHVTTKKCGRRYELACVIKRICNSLKIPCIVPADELGEDTSLYLPEAVTAHYSRKGEEMIAQVYKRYLEAGIVLNPVVQVYYTDAERMRKHTFHGLGDYLRGCVFLQTVYGDRMITDISHHGMSEFIYSPAYHSLEEHQHTEYIFQENAYRFNQILHSPSETHVFTNYGEIMKPPKHVAESIVSKCLMPRLVFKQKIEALMLSLGIETGSYDVLHIRAGDRSGLVTTGVSNLAWVQALQVPVSTKLIVLCDSEELDAWFNQHGYVTTRSKKAHMGIPGDLETTLLDFFLLTKARHIYQKSMYSWGSGFSTWASYLFDVPLTRI
jgi:hypothetical protein